MTVPQSYLSRALILAGIGLPLLIVGLAVAPGQLSAGSTAAAVVGAVLFLAAGVAGFAMTLAGDSDGAGRRGLAGLALAAGAILFVLISMASR